ncbi:aminotransferase class III-fold pyridoxal phosphate-dependent enzyme [Candidatus Thiosymbion oneisti]|uniref:aminotransferase class III-fold pyridoxal phosphate-dependent enzyme n=1 Tax=Candidatus Thiosymbion oneisti TaxID=589554 RepID=UPI000AF9AB52|nr:aminotransferase class III-fold pyridoxal phosphate-dependent enzyme [Candidatus Thiosymbion oneisti]
MKTLAIVQARMGSTRFPSKVMQPILGKPMIGLLLHRLSLAKRIDRILLATSDHSRDRPLVEYVRELGYAVYRGSEKDVLDRYYQAAKPHKPAAVVRITGDCPLIDPAVVDAVVGAFHADAVDYLSNTGQRTFPDGLDTEVFSFPALERASREATRPHEREHVTPYLRESGNFSLGNYPHEEDCSAERWTVDEPEDLDVVRYVFTHFHPRLDFGWLEVLAWCRQQPELFAANRHLPSNEGATMGTGQKLWRRAKRIIPGGNMLLSKRAEMFLPEQWPAYFSRAQGCRVWDLDDREYIDMSFMGIGTNILGYGHPEVDEAVMQTVRAGNMSTLNCPEEVALAERLIDLHPWAEMVRFARSGGETNAIAIRIARAASGRDKIAICGYHGWHDWYLSANLADDHNLDGHLLPGLEPKGVPRNLAGTVFPFTYNRFDELEALVAQQDIGVIKMEVSRNLGPQESFLQNVRKLAIDKDIVLIFDECTSGFRETLGGLHKKFGVEPDLAIFGKALGNGYAITAVIGRRAVMEAAQSTFISSTFWTERIGPSAALKTLEVMERKRSWERITTTGHAIAENWRRLADDRGVRIDLSGLPALIGFAIQSPQALEYKTLITQEMLAKGYLAATSVYVCTEHTSEVIDGYFDALDGVFDLIGECEQGRDVTSLLKGTVCHTGFKRLN